jgi:putative endonuclease
VRRYRRAGYEVIARNWRCAHGEIDLIVSSAACIAFVEVKARANERFGAAAAAVDHRKQRRLRRLAGAWLAEHRSDGRPVRFDVVAITGTRVDVFEGAF